jgi:hypothetical protein
LNCDWKLRDLECVVFIIWLRRKQPRTKGRIQRTQSYDYIPHSANCCLICRFKISMVKFTNVCTC